MRPSTPKTDLPGDHPYKPTGSAGRDKLYARHFTQVAQRYDDLRDEAAPPVIAQIVEHGGLGSCTGLVDVGCGTGASTAALARFVPGRVVGVDASPAMLAVARRRAARVTWLQGSAEALGFPDASFDRVLMQTVVHLLDRPRAFAEARRILEAGGRLVVLTVDPARLRPFWLARLSEAWLALERERFPTGERLAAEVVGQGLLPDRTVTFERHATLSREQAVRMLRARFASSLAVLPRDEVEAMIEKAECSLPDHFDVGLPLLLLTARRA